MIVYSTRELRAKIASHDYSAELCLQHAMANIGALEMEMEALREDAERARWLADRMLAADFDYCGDGTQVLVFEMPAGFSASADFAATIDAAMAKEPR